MQNVLDRRAEASLKALTSRQRQQQSDQERPESCGAGPRGWRETTSPAQGRRRRETNEVGATRIAPAAGPGTPGTCLS
jgi:hypothetical protein